MWFGSLGTSSPTLTAPRFIPQAVPLVANMACKGVVFALELGLLSLKEKTAIRQRIEKAGGTISAIVGSSVRVVITTTAARASGSFKLVSAEKLGIPVFLLEELDEVLSFPPAPREVPSPTRSTSNRVDAAHTSVTQAPLLVWDAEPTPSSRDEYIAPSYSSSFESSSPYPTYEDDIPAYDEDENPFFGLALADNLLDSYERDAPRYTSVSRPDVPPKKPAAEPSVSAALNESTDSAFLFNMGSLFDGSSTPTLASSLAFQPKPTPTKSTSTKLASRATAKPVKWQKKTSQPLTTSVATASEARLAREAKYREITSKVAQPLLAAPLRVTQPTFTALTFDLKPASAPSTPAKLTTLKLSAPKTTTRIGYTRPATPVPESIIFETVAGIKSVLSSGDSSPTSAASLQSSSCSIVRPSACASEPESPTSLFSDEVSEFSGANRVRNDDFEDYNLRDGGDDDDLDAFGDMEGESGLDASSVGDLGCAAISNTKQSVKRWRMARLYVDQRTGAAWQRADAKNKRAPTKLILVDSNRTVTRVFDSVKGTISSNRKERATAPKEKASADASLIASPIAANPDNFGPALPSSGSVVPTKAFRSHLNPKFSWLDVATGKASLKKRVPAMDGQKIFVSGITFDDLVLRGKPREEQLASYKEEHLKKVKEKNAKTMRTMKKKLKKKQAANARVDANGTIIADNKELEAAKAQPKLSQAKELERMKTDEQLLGEIDVWTAAAVATAIQHRKTLIQSIFNRFGEFSTWSPEWEKGYIHITYKNANAANAAVKALKDFDTRNAVIRTLKERFPKTPKAAFPSASFYVRWTACYQRKLTKKAEAAKAQTLANVDAAVAKHAVAAATSVSKKSSSSSKK